MLDTNEAQRLLITLAQQETEKRHADDNTIDTPPQISSSEVLAWLRSLAPLTDEQIYDSGWRN